MATDLSPVVNSLIKLCAGSPKRIEILEAVRKAKHYIQVAKETKSDPEYVSTVLTRAKNWNIVEGEKGIFRQTKELRALNIRSEIKHAAQKSSVRVKINMKKGETMVRFSDDLKISNPNLPESVVMDAKKMLGVYPYLYLFENSVRYLILRTMNEKYGVNWWKMKVSRPAQMKAEERAQREGKNRWHGKRGQHPIFYVDIDDLRTIISSNNSDFQSRFPAVKRPLEWIQQRLEEIEISRNVVAHNNPLNDDDIDRVKIFFKDWVKQMEDVKS